MTRVVFAIAALALVAAGAALATEHARDMSGQKEKAMRNCPSAVVGAVTTVDDRKDGVQLTVVAADDAGAKEIQQRAHTQENVAAQPARGALEHTGEGTGSGLYGFCPGMQQNTVVKVEDLPDGALLTVHSRSPGDVPALQQTTRTRLRNLRASR
jgi:hypothetical protein